MKSSILTVEIFFIKILMTLFRFTTPQVQLNIVGKPEGIILVSWRKDPNITTSILSYSYQTDFTATFNVTKNITLLPNVNQVAINDTYLDSNYTFDMFCDMSEMLYACGSMSFFGFPSCLDGWTSFENNCYYFSQEQVSFNESVKKCASLEDTASSSNNKTPTNQQIDNMTNPLGNISNGLFWVGSKPSCLKGSHGESCCVSIPDINNPTNKMVQSEPISDCHIEHRLRYVCIARLQANTSQASNLSVRTINSTSVNVTWDVTPGPWIPIEWTIALTYDMHSIVEIPVHANATSAVLANVTYGKKHLLILQPGKYGSLKQSGVKKRFLISDDILYTTNITNDGKVNIEWPINANVEPGNTTFIIKYHQNKTVNMTKEEGLALSGFKFGVNETFKITAVKSNQVVLNTANFTVFIVPTCNPKEIQYKLTCYTLIKEVVDWENAYKTCAAKREKLATPTTAENTDFIVNISTLPRINESFWISGKAEALAKSYGVASLSGSDSTVKVNENTDPVQIHSSCKFVNSSAGIQFTHCENYLPALCERRIAVAMSAVQNVTLASVNDSEIVIKWKNPPSSWQPATVKITCTPALGRRKKRAAASPDIVINEEMATISGLQPQTDYTVTVTPQLTSDYLPAPVNGQTTTISAKTPAAVATTEATTTPTTTAIITTVSSTPSTTSPRTTTRRKSPSTVPNIIIGGPPSNDWIEKWNVNSLFAAMRFISCAILVGLLCVSLIIQIFCRMFVFRDCISEICLEMCIIVSCVLVFLGSEYKKQIFCKAVAIANQYFFIACFCFLALQSICILKSMTKILPLGTLAKRRYIFLFGWGIPACIVGASAGTLHSQYGLPNELFSQQCWVTMCSSIFYITVVPIGVFLIIAIVSLILSFCARPVNNYEVDEESYIRHKPLEDMRWVMLFVALLMGFNWIDGVMAYQKMDERFLVAYFVLNIILGFAILILRCIGDDEIRYRMRLCCSKPTIRPEDQDLSHLYIPEGVTYMQRGMGTLNPSINRESSLIFKRSYNFQP